jgi:dihydroxy-acid dehydratase
LHSFYGLTFIIGHVTPEAQLGGPIALVEDGDKVLVDANTKKIEWLVDDATVEARRAKWEQKGERPFKANRGVLFRYARDVAVSFSNNASGTISDVSVYQ